MFSLGGHLFSSPSLRQFVEADHALLGALEAMIVIHGSCRIVFAFATLDTLAPEVEARSLHFTSHQLDYFLFVQAKLPLDGIEGGAVLPGHFDDPVHVFLS